MKILGIDPGLATIGYGVIERLDKIDKVLDYGVILTPKEETLPVRLAMIYDNVTKLIITHKPDCVAVEELFFYKNITTGISVAEARGAILTAVVRECGKLYEYTPLQIKMALTGYGRADKNQIQQMVKLILKLDKIPKPDDAADALAVALTHLNSGRLGEESYIK
ncbi:MAG: crossover junction endodeoxyribonuclease RuvC [Clostridia bacterium]